VINWIGYLTGFYFWNGIYRTQIVVPTDITAETNECDHKQSERRPFYCIYLHCTMSNFRNQINHQSFYHILLNSTKTGKFCSNEKIARICSKFHGPRKTVGPSYGTVAQLQGFNRGTLTSGGIQGTDFTNHTIEPKFYKPTTKTEQYNNNKYEFLQISTDDMPYEQSVSKQSIEQPLSVRGFHNPAPHYQNTCLTFRLRHRHCHNLQPGPVTFHATTITHSTLVSWHALS